MMKITQDSKLNKDFIEINESICVYLNIMLNNKNSMNDFINKLPELNVFGIH